MKIVAEKQVSSYLKELGKKKQTIPGLILGQKSKNKCSIIHAVRNHEWSEQSLSLLDHSSSIISHAQQVARMLPGGIHVLGIFCMSGTDSLPESKDNSLLNLMKSIKIHLKADEKDNFNLVLHFNFTDNSSSIQFFDSISKPSVLPIEFKKINWQHAQCFMNLSMLSSCFFSEQTSLKVQSEVVLNKVEKILNESLFSLNGAFYDYQTPLKSIEKSKGSKVLSLDILLPCSYEESVDKEGFYPKSYVEEITFSGVLGSNVYLNEDATFDDAIEAVKSDIKRSLSSRLDMHLDSLLEGEVNFQEMKTVHEPPRRILINLPECEVQLSDYLFPGESPAELSEALESLQDLLDIDVTICVIDKDFENPSEFHDESEIDSSATSDKSIACNLKNKDSTLGSKMILLVVAVLIGLAAIVFHLIPKKPHTN